MLKWDKKSQTKKTKNKVCVFSILYREYLHLMNQLCHVVQIAAYQQRMIMQAEMTFQTTQISLTLGIIKGNSTKCIKFLAFWIVIIFKVYVVNNTLTLSIQKHKQKLYVFWNLTTVLNDLSPICQCHNVTGKSLLMSGIDDA